MNKNAERRNGIEKLPGEITNKKRFMLVIAHPDDEAFVGPFIVALSKRGYETNIYALTQGGMGSNDTSFFSEFRTVRTRRTEFKRAGNTLGAKKVEILNGPDGRLKEHTGRISRRLLRRIREDDPDFIISHDSDPIHDYHIDHITAGTIAEATAYAAQDGPRRLRAEKFPWRLLRATKKHRVFLAMDTQGLTTRASKKSEFDENNNFNENNHPNKVDIIVRVTQEDVDTALIAFQEHQSQMNQPPDGTLSYPEQARREYEFRGKQAGFEYGIGFEIVSHGGHKFATLNQTVQQLGEIFGDENIYIVPEKEHVELSERELTLLELLKLIQADEVFGQKFEELMLQFLQRA